MEVGAIIMETAFGSHLYGTDTPASDRDWKALSHAVRVGRQAVELLTTGHVTFPRPEAAHLVAIKTGQLAYAPVADEIEQLLADVERASAASSLPPQADRAFMDDLIVKAYRQVVAGG